jgi:CRP/FNR family transcriptional regulator
MCIQEEVATLEGSPSCETKMDKISILTRFAFYSMSPPSYRSVMEEAAHSVQLRTGQFFYREGGACPHVAMVGTGMIRVCKCGETGRDITLYHVQDGETCPVNMLCAIVDREAPASAVAESAVEGLIVPARTFQDWIATIPPVRKYVFETIATKMMDLIDLVAEVAFAQMDERLGGLLLQRAEAHGKGPRVLELTHMAIAKELGTAREIVSRLLKDFERAGAIALHRGRVEIRDEFILHEVSKSSRKE